MAIEHIPPSTYILRNAVDVSVPEGMVSWMPQTIGWKIVFLIVFALLCWWSYRRAQHWWMHRYRGECLRALEAIEASYAPDRQAQEISFVLKQCAIYAYGADRVAPLYGVDWLEFLDLSCDQSAFRSEDGKAWQSALLSPEQGLADSARANILSQAKIWVKHHRREATDG